MKAILIFTLIFVHFSGHSQSEPSEFEGRIYYINTFLIKDPMIDSVDLVKRMGYASVYTYKKGKFLWSSQGSNFQFEIYDPQTALVMDKYSDRDTLHVIDVFLKADSMISYKIIKSADIICGYVCDAIELKIKSSNDGSLISRTIYYTSRLHIDPMHFRRYRSYANNQVYQIIQAVPLRIVMDFEGFPVTIIMNAERVEVVSIDDREFQLK